LKIGIVALMDLVDRSIYEGMLLKLEPVVAPQKGLAAKAEAHVSEQEELARMFAKNEQEQLPGIDG
jgi:hypothetical protein